MFQLEEMVKWKPAVGRAAKCQWKCPLFSEPADANKANAGFSRYLAVTKSQSVRLLWGQNGAIFLLRVASLVY